jgi:hypothetical protein
LRKTGEKEGEEKKKGNKKNQTVKGGTRQLKK